MRTLNVKRFLTFEFIYEFVELLLFCSFFGICRFCFVLCIFMQEPSAVNWYEFSGILGISFCILWVVINIILFVPSLSILIVDVGFPNLEYAVNLVHSWAGNSVADSCIAYRKGDKMFSGHGLVLRAYEPCVLQEKCNLIVMMNLLHDTQTIHMLNPIWWWISCISA